MDNTSGRVTDNERTPVKVEVEYNTSAEPSRIKFFHSTFGMMRFNVEDRTAVIDPEWNRLSDNDLKDQFDRWITTGDVIYSVLRLPFIEEVDASEVKRSYEQLDSAHGEMA